MHPEQYTLEMCSYTSKRVHAWICVYAWVCACVCVRKQDGGFKQSQHIYNFQLYAYFHSFQVIGIHNRSLEILHLCEMSLKDAFELQVRQTSKNIKKINHRILHTKIVYSIKKKKDLA